VSKAVNDVFEEIIKDPHDDGLLDRYIDKTRRYMIKNGLERFEINKSVAPWAKLSRPGGRAFPQKGRTGYEGAIIRYSKSENDLETRAIVAHELGHIALHFDKLSDEKYEPEKHDPEEEKEATEFARLVLMDRSKRNEKLKDTDYASKNYYVEAGIINEVLERLFPITPKK
jgi:hypothetical protein